MRLLEQLGFSLRHAIGPAWFAEVSKQTSIALPNSYVQFLAYAPPAHRMFAFKFHRGADNVEWEGQVERFFDYGRDLKTLEKSLLRSDDHLLLPIANDAGGNEVLLDLLSPEQPVVDHDYQTGELSIIASTFEAFMNSLYSVE